MTEHIRVVIADDDEKIRTQIHKLVGCQEHMRVMAEAGNSRDAMAIVQHHLPDLLLLDIDMPDMNGLRALQRIRHDHPRTQVVIVSRDTDPASVEEAQALGARGYVAKRDLAEELIPAVETVMGGRSFLSRAVNQEKTRSTTLARGTRAAENPEANMTTQQHRNTVALSSNTLTLAEDYAASTETRAIRMLVVDDEPSVSRDIRNMLSQDRRIEIFGTCETEKTAMEVIEQQSPLDLVLLDLGLRHRRRGGWQVVRKDHSGIPVIVYTRSTDQADVSEAWRHGIAGYVPKQCDSEELIRAILTVHSGETYFSPVLGERVWRPSMETKKLTPREREVFYLFVRDCSTKEIAEELRMEDTTVFAHMLKIRRKIGHQHGWKGVAKEMLKDADLLSELAKLERKVFDQYVGGMTQAEKLAEALRVPVSEVKDILREIRRKLYCHPDGWKGIAKDEGDIH